MRALRRTTRVSLLALSALVLVVTAVAYSCGETHLWAPDVDQTVRVTHVSEVQ